MEQMRQNEAGALTAQAIPQKDVEQACFHALGLIGRNCEYLDPVSYTHLTLPTKA